MTTPEDTPPLPDHQRPQAPPNHDPIEGEGPPEPAGARYANRGDSPSASPFDEEDLTVRGRVPPATGCEDGRPRSCDGPRRTRRITVTYTGEELSAVAAAARAAGLTPTGYTAEAALAAACALRAPALAPARAALSELMIARTQVRRFGTNVNQAMRALNSTGTVPDWLPLAVALTSRAIERLDVVAVELARAVRSPAQTGTSTATHPERAPSD